MNKLEKFALHSALQPSDTFINECFTPITVDKFISFDASIEKPSYSYNHWQEVIDFISPSLKEKGISILRIGDSKGHPIDGVIDYRGKSFNQDSYIISKSLLHFGCSDLLSFVSKHFNKKQVKLFSAFNSTDFPFEKTDRDVFIDSDKKGFNPTYSDHDPRDSINTISPSLVASKILDSIGVESELGELERVYHGHLSHVKTIEIIPDFTPDPNFLANSLINLRADLNFDEQSIFNFASSRRKLGIITKKSFSKELVQAIRPSLNRITINATNGLDYDFVKFLKKLNINYEIFVDNDSNLSKVRLDYIDETIEHYPKKLKKDVDIEIDSGYTMLMRSSKLLISKGNTYPSKAHWIVGETINPGLQKVIDTEDFWEDSDFMNIYKIKNKNKNDGS